MGHRNKRITQYRLFLLSIKIPCRYCAGAGVDIIVNDVNDYIVEMMMVKLYVAFID
jgi:hypothetical protein